MGLNLGEVERKVTDACDINITHIHTQFHRGREGE